MEVRRGQTVILKMKREMGSWGPELWGDPSTVENQMQGPWGLERGAQVLCKGLWPILACQEHVPTVATTPVFKRGQLLGEVS